MIQRRTRNKTQLLKHLKRKFEKKKYVKLNCVVEVIEINLEFGCEIKCGVVGNYHYTNGLAEVQNYISDIFLKYYNIDKINWICESDNIHTISALPLEPERVNRFLVSFPENLDIQNYQVERVSSISYNYSDQAWDIVCIRFYGYIGPSAEDAIYQNIIRRNLNTINRITISNLDPTGVITRTWELNNCTIERVEFDQFDYSSDDIRRIKMYIRPESCKLI